MSGAGKAAAVLAVVAAINLGVILYIIWRLYGPRPKGGGGAGGPPGPAPGPSPNPPAPRNTPPSDQPTLDHVPFASSAPDSGILFVSAEKYGFVDMKAQNEVPKMPSSLTSAVLIQIEGAPANIYKTAAYRVAKNNPDFAFQFFYQPDVTKGSFSAAQSTPGNPASRSDQLVKIWQKAIDAINSTLAGMSSAKAKVTGIHFDWESEFDFDSIALAFNKLKQNQTVKYISFTKSISTDSYATQKLAKAYDGVDSVTFDFGLAQCYTDTTSRLYSDSSCGSVDVRAATDAWKQAVPNPSTFAVPMFCIGGNCQGDLPYGLTDKPEASENDCNIDERLDTTGMSIIAKAFADIDTPNFGFWSGYGVKSDLCPRCAAT